MDRKIDFVTNEADERPIYAVFGDILWCRDTGNEYIYDGSTWQEYKMRYKDLGLVIDAINVAAGASVYSNNFYNLKWVKNVKIMATCDQTHSLYAFPIDTLGNKTGNGQGFTSQTALSNASVLRGYTLANASVPFTTSGILGHGATFSIKNESTSSATFAKLFIQLLD